MKVKVRPLRKSPSGAHYTPEFAVNSKTTIKLLFGVMYFQSCFL